MKVAQCKFYGSTRAYDYVIPTWLENSVREGSWAVVESPHNGYTVVFVEAIIDKLDSGWPKGDFKSLVDTVDVTSYEDMLARRRRARAIEAELARRSSRALKIAEYKKLAESDPEIAKLVQELEGLDV